MNQDFIVIKGARENNLKNIDLKIPRNQLVIMTGLSGSGKTSLAFDTIYAEGQRRYVESLSAYARQFLGNTEKPDVDLIEGLSPSISIDQKTTSNNPRSTVGTVTEIYDYLRLLYARVGIPYCPNHDEPIVSQTIRQMVDRVMASEDGARLNILAPVDRQAKGTHKDLFDKLRKDGYVRVRVNGEIKLLEDEIVLEKNKKHDIDVVVDRIVKQSDSASRLHDSLEVALKLADGLAIVDTGHEELLFSSNYSCPKCGFSISIMEPRLFSFNSPLGACATCKGLGVTQKVDVDYLIPDRNKTIAQGGIVYYKNIINSENIEWQSFRILC
ncbi:MAG: excinuclease ABC subunit UvrA, partial [Erysipelotrichales bacterium]